MLKISIFILTIYYNFSNCFDLLITLSNFTHVIE
jgi:hypothetical protein